MSSAPDSHNTADLFNRYVLSNYARTPLTLVKGQGTRVWDDTGRVYLDFTGGIAVNSLGHCHPDWVKAVQEQAAKLVHVSNLYYTQAQAELASRLVNLAGPGKVFFCNSGAEANEAAIKLARLHGCRLAGEEGSRYTVLTAHQAFHGRTFGGMAATPQAKIQNKFRPMLPGFRHAALNDLDGFAREIAQGDVAAVMVETIQGEGGIHCCTRAFLQGLRTICDEHDVLLILDEVQCGSGRTGRYFAYEHCGVQADAVAMAKGLASGFPIGALWVAERHASLFEPGCHGSTFGGGLLACTAALATLDIIERDQLLDQVTRFSSVWLERLRLLQEKHPQIIAELRGCGYLIGLAVKEDPAPIIERLRKEGLLAISAGGQTIRLLPPLTVSQSELDEACSIIERIISG